MAGVARSLYIEPTGSEDDCPLQCFNKGTCDYHGVTNEFYCDCPLTQSGGFQGVRCETPFLECTDGARRGWRCLNGGQCQTGDTDEVCHCPDEFTGNRCEIFSGPPTNSNDGAATSSSGPLRNYGAVEKNANQLPGGAVFGFAMTSVVLSAVFFAAGYLAGRRGGSDSIEFASSTTNSEQQPEAMLSRQDNEAPELPCDANIT
mmetsp:Transcript_26238/g.56265  ORF Transcript_26238/g.56265 Transcript_26238/m.56265 type:complete len:203 (-) Transcript_26238:84-692(-)|eukprot:CAMPEP_0201259440 /NCGR_PEP_ID=MMETSP0853-20130426/3755_1 /ASSEMBLY_ACC=CAM_ASM_000640 /TAXON_ID=183588 /ORGANISM="Pseudo-nitzschia fraudulenta, Strain WWA7" /LENGTH=202 /DNA_ID=CAMNT_0047561553 /DNA_START=66 /DNA_END=674 /DNA_ORIENTATION=-